MTSTAFLVEFNVGLLGGERAGLRVSKLTTIYSCCLFAMSFYSSVIFINNVGCEVTVLETLLSCGSLLRIEVEHATQQVDGLC